MTSHVTHLVKKNAILTACGRQTNVITQVAMVTTSSLSEFMADQHHCKVCEKFALEAIAKRQKAE